jgi:heme-degrading monooxygenase HmoA
MSEIIEIDPRFTFIGQLQSTEGPIVMLNIFRIDQEDIDAFERHWAHTAAFMKQQDGFISQQLHRGLDGAAVYMNYGVWEYAGALRSVFQSDAFQALRGGYPKSAKATPFLFKAKAVDGICIGW